MTCALPTTLPLRILHRNGVKLAVHDSGPVAAQAAPLVCIHGNSCDHGFFAPLIERFSPTRRVVAVDLRGHGASDAPRQNYPFSLFAQDCVWIMERLELSPAILVGHSMGGEVSVEAALAVPDRVIGLALLDSTLQPPSAALAAALPSLLATMDSDRWMEAFDAFFHTLFLPPGQALCPDAFQAAIHERMARTPHHVMRALMADLAEYGGAPLGRVSVPMLYLGAERLRSDPDALARENPRLVTDRLRGLGHFMMLEDPKAVKDRLERFFHRVDALRP